MSLSKPLPPFVCDSLYYLNRDQLERFSIISHQLKNFIERYFHSKPYRLFDHLSIYPGFIQDFSSFSRSDLCFNLSHNGVEWHPNRDDYNAQQFLAGQECFQECNSIDFVEGYSFGEMRPYLVPTVRISEAYINIDVHNDFTYNPELITEMESIAYLWRDYNLEIDGFRRRIEVNDILPIPILNSTTILQCRFLQITNACFPFKDYKVLYTVKIIELIYDDDSYDDTDLNYWADFLEQPGVKPIVVVEFYRKENIDILLDRLKEAFSFAVVPNVFKLVIFVKYGRLPLTEFRETNKISGEILELKKGCPAECQEEYSGHIDMKNYDIYTLERSNI